MIELSIDNIDAILMELIQHPADFVRNGEI